jgi:hypothetical protein
MATMCRANADVLKDLCSFNPVKANPMDRLPHDCYMIMVGYLSKEHVMMLKEMTESKRISSTNKTDKIQAEYEVLNSEELESVVEYIQLLGRTEQLENQRNGHFVFEDNFNSSLIDIIEKDSSYEKLKRVCRRYEKKEGINVNKVMAEHENRVALSHSYFLDKNLPLDEAKALAFSLSFYTGTKSEACSRGASLVARTSNGEAVEVKTQEEMNEAAIILYYLVKALSYIPFHWGYVTRACKLTFDELNIYMPGCLITWIQFSSSKKGKKGVATQAFSDRNVLFKIFSLTGRSIKQFSNYGEEEDEVLFLPHSTFLVLNRDTQYENEARKVVIYMRQVELGLCKWSVLWVDDKIFNEDWENKRHMEYAAVKALDMNVHFIPKSTTESALSFLRSAFGQRLKNRETFRIVTDMNRENEASVHDAGARLIKAVRQMGFNNECLVFTSDKRKAENILQSKLNSREQQSVTVSDVARDLRNFVNFNQKPTHAQQSNVENSSKFSTSQKSTYSSKLKKYIRLRRLIKLQKKTQSYSSTIYCFIVY